MDNLPSPVRRDWLGEAYQIHAGNKRIPIKIEHISALVTTLNGLINRMDKLQEVAARVYTDSKLEYEKAGLKMPELPEDLKRVTGVK